MTMACSLLHRLCVALSLAVLLAAASVQGQSLLHSLLRRTAAASSSAASLQTAAPAAPAAPAAGDRPTGPVVLILNDHGARASQLIADSNVVNPGLGNGQGQGQGQAGNAGATATITQAGIYYHNGPVMLGTVNVYLIWYGAEWVADNDTALTLLPTLITGLSGSPWHNIQTTYTNAAGVRLSNSINLAGTYFSPTTYGNALTDAQIFAVVTDALAAGALPVDANGIYFVLTSRAVTATSGFCSQYCGWHNHGAYSGVDIKFSFVGNAATQCLSGCSGQPSVPGPNGNPGADAMASVLAHELVEAASDPDLNAWFDRRGYENADKCAWTFGTTYTTPNGSKANMKLAGLDFLIQQNWVNAGRGACAVKYP